MSDPLNIKSEEEVMASHKPIMLFGRDILQIACFRNSLICGICTGVVGGLTSFLATSKTLFSTHVAFGSVWVGVLAYWIPCRYRYETEALAADRIAKKLREMRGLPTFGEDGSDSSIKDESLNLSESKVEK